MASQNFLRFLVDPPHPTIDIVAIHGLNPKNTAFHAQETWNLGGKLWLKDFLPNRIPGARVLLFGYKSNIAFETSTAGVREHAENLLNRLKSKRRTTPNRPIIFVCHNLGGIVVKQALVHAKLDETYAAIRASTYGIAFFGTPHQGGNNVFLGAIASRVAQAVLRHPSNTFLEALKKDALYGEEMRQNFRHSLEDFQILSFFETREFKKMGFIVDKKSATLGLAGTREKQIAIDADHNHICKFESEEDDNYDQVVDNLEEMVEEAVKALESQNQLANLQPPVTQVEINAGGATTDLEACLRSLSFPEMETAIRRNSPKLVEMLLGHRDIDLHPRPIDGKVICTLDVTLKTPGVDPVIIDMVRREHEEQNLNPGVTQCDDKKGQNKNLKRT